MAEVSPSVAACMSDMAAEILALRTRLAEVEAERDRERLINRGNGESAAWLNVHVVLAKERDRAEAAEAKLAEVYALCQRNFNLEDYYEIDANDVAAIIEGAAARGEGER